VLGLCADGDVPTPVDNGDTTYGGKWLVNPSSGRISKGTCQLRGAAGRGQVDMSSPRGSTISASAALPS